MTIRTIKGNLALPSPNISPLDSGGEIYYDRLDRTTKNLPRVLSSVNVMPTKRGLSSLISRNYKTVNPAHLPTTLNPVRVVIVYDVAGAYTFYAHLSGHHYVVDPASDAWIDLGADGLSSLKESHAFINGTSYVFKSNSGINTFDAAWAGFTTQTVQGITATSMEGICEALDYMIAWDIDTVYWSAPAAPLDFRPIVATVSTGAGSAKLQELKGTIICCFGIAGGYLIYGTRNIVSAKWSGNSLNPWIFKEVAGSNGVHRFDHIAPYSTSRSHFVNGLNGIQEVNLDQASNVLPELSSFLSGGLHYQSDGDGTYTARNSLVNLEGKLTLISNRYLCVSYRQGGDSSTFSGVYIFDIELKQYGHVAVNHYDIFDFLDVDAGPYTNGYWAGREAMGAIGLWDSSYDILAINLATMDVKPTQAGWEDMDSEVVFGGLQFAHDLILQLSKVKIHGVKDSSVTVDVLTSDRAGERAAVASFPEDTVVDTEYLGDVTGVSHKVIISGGKFTISSVDFQTANKGRL